KRHLRERSRDVVARFYGLSVGAERYASDLRDSHPGSGRKNPHHLKARGKAAFSLLFQTNMDGVKLLVAIDGCTERAAPHHGRGEVPVREVGVVLVPAGLELLDQACDCVNRFLCLNSFSTQCRTVRLTV